MNTIDFRESLIEYIKNSLSNDEEFKNDNINVDKAYSTKQPTTSSIFVYIMDNTEAEMLLSQEGNPYYTFQIYVYGKKMKHNGKLVSAMDMTTLLVDFVIKYFNRNVIKDNINNIISIKRVNTSPILPLDDSIELYYSAVRYEGEIQ